MTTPQPAYLSSSLSHEAMLELANELARVKSQQDVDAAMRIYHPECVLDTPSMGVCAKGAKTVRRHLESWFTIAPDYHVTLEGSASNGRELASWGTIALTLSGTFEGHVPNGQRAHVPAFILFGFADGYISWERFSFDLASLSRQCGVPAEALYPKRRTEPKTI